MAILQQLKRDEEFLRNLISNLKSECTKVISNGVLLSGSALEEVLELARSEKQLELQKLELILESGIVPEKYHSIITEQDYYPSVEERKKMSEPLPPAKHSFFVVKKSRNTTDQKLSSFTVVKDDQKSVMNFFMEHDKNKKYPKGGFAARLKKGYLKEGDDEKPKYAIKIYHQNMFKGNTIHELRVAMRAAYCYRQLGRDGLSFRRNSKQYMVTEWLLGANLDNAEQKHVQSMPIPRRIVMAISVLRELSILHRLGLIHHDIKPGNVIINYGKSGFVDLDSVTPKNESPLAGSTPMYTDRYLPTPQMSYDATYNPRKLYLKFNEKTDIYQMGLTLAYLFQEIYVPKEVDKVIKVDGGSQDTFTYKTIVLTHGTEYDKHSELQKLLKQMVFQEKSSPVTADECIEAFQKVLSTYPDFEKYLAEDRLIDVGKDVSLKDGEKAFKEIEIELLAFNQRLESVRKLKTP